MGWMEGGREGGRGVEREKEGGRKATPHTHIYTHTHLTSSHNEAAKTASTLTLLILLLPIAIHHSINDPDRSLAGQRDQCQLVPRYKGRLSQVIIERGKPAYNTCALRCHSS